MARRTLALGAWIGLAGLLLSGPVALHDGALGRPPRSRAQAQAQAQAQARAQAARGLAARYGAARETAERHAAAAAARAAALSAASVGAASEAQRTERNAAGAAERVLALAVLREQAQRALDADARALAPLVPVATRLSLYPAETLLAAPLAPGDAVTGLMVLRGMAAELERRARDVRDNQARLEGLAGRLTAEQARLLVLQRRQSEQQAAIAARAEAAAAVQRASDAAADQATRLAADAAARAATLGDAVARIEAAEQAAQARFARQAAVAEAARQPDAARTLRREAASVAPSAWPGLVPGAGADAPVAGRLAQGFGQPGLAGASTGLVYASDPLATVTAPCASRVDFAGPFRSYGRMLILDCGREYRFVLAGLDRLDVAVGQALARGAPVGRMAAWPDHPGGGAGRPSLYVQLRHADATIDPDRFLRGGR